MRLAWKEIKYNKSKYMLIEIILILMIFMVVFLSGLANGLARAVSSAIENTDAQYFIISDDAQDLITVSSLETEILDKVKESTSDKVTMLNIKRMNLNSLGSTTKMDVTYFAIDPNAFLNPNSYEGEMLSNEENIIVLDDSFMDEGIKIGDIIQDSSTEIEMTVVGFTKDAMYGHTSVGYITMETYTAIQTAINPNYEVKYHTLAVQGSNVNNINIDGIEIADKKTIVDNLPGYSAEQMTINMILWVLIVISAAILGVFFYVITIQKQKQFGVLKAIGMSMGEITRMIVAQVMLLAISGVVVGNILAFAMSQILPKSMPFYIKITDIALTSVVFIIISLLCSLISTRKIAKVDPIITIGGNE